MKNGTLKKSLSVFLAILMIVPTLFATGAPGLLSLFDGVVIEAEAAIAGIKIVVPETLYLTPSTGSQTAIQYYINNNADGSVKTSQDTTAEVYITYPGATLTSISAKTSSAITLPASITGLVGTTFGTSATKATGTFSLGAGLSAGSTALVEWTFVFDVDGQTKTHYAYSVAYAPWYQPVGAASKAVGSWHNTYASSILWVQGVHGYSDGDRANSWYVQTANFLPMLGNLKAPSNNNPDTNWIQSGSNGLSPTMSYNVITESGTNYHARANTISPTANITVDTSRYNNFNQIPNFSVGFMVTDKDGITENKGTHAWYVSDYGTNNGSSYYNGTDRGSSQYTSDWNDTGTKIWYSDSDNACGIKVNQQSWNKGISGTANFRLKSAARSEYKATITTTGWNNNFVNISVTGANKGTLRTNVLNGTSYAKENYTADTWNTYYAALKTAATNLCNPTSATVDTADLTNAEAGLHTTLTLNANGGNLGENVPLNVAMQVGGNPTTSFNNADVIDAYYATRTGYTFLGWSTDKNATSAPATVTVGLNDTVYAVWKANTYYAIFDNLIDYNAWNKAAGNGVVSDVTENGFTITCNDGAGEATSESPYFAVTPGKSYKIKMDFIGDNWDVYIFFCDENGSWIDFADGPSNRYSSNGSTGIDPDNAVFTAPNKAEVVKAKIRVDSNNANNVVRFENIRVYEVGKVAEGVSYETAMLVTYDSPYGTLPTPVKTGYTFDGWLRHDDTYITESSVMKITENSYLTSRWTENRYTVAYNANGSNDAVEAPKTYNYTETVTVAAAIERVGHTFAGWKSDANGEIYQPGEVVPALTAENDVTVTLTAQWNINSYTLTFVNNAGTTVETKAYDYGTAGSDVTLPANTAAHYDGINHYNYTWPTVADVTGDATYNETKKTEAHVFTETVITDSTCTATGTKKLSCACGYETTKEIPMKAHSLSFVAKVDAKCGIDGTGEHYKCSVCGGLFADANGSTPVTAEQLVIPALEHQYGEVKHAATCTMGSYSTFTCSLCNDTYSTDPADDLIEHPYVLTENNPEPDCTNAGVAHYTCSACGASKTEDLEALGHSMQFITGTPATCTSAGTVDHYKCTRCSGLFADADGENALDSIVDPIKDHTPGEAAKENVVPATCTVEGSHEDVVKCTVCSTELSRTPVVDPMITHTAADAVEEGRVPSTCTVAGYYNSVVYCSVCNTKLSSTKVDLPLAAHTEEIIPAVESTCTVAGKTEGTKCSVCGEILVAQQDTALKPHTEGETVVENNVDPDCENAGSYDNVVYCTVCKGELSRVTVTVDALGHTEATREEVTLEATCGAPGSKNIITYCTVCNAELNTVTEAIPATGAHVYATEVEGSRVDATCVETGTVTMACTCGATEEQTLAIDSTNHANLVTDAAVAATCTATGLTEGQHCEACGVVTLAQQTTDKLAHTEDTREEVTLEATCGKDGSKNIITYCTVCKNDLKTVEETIPATGKHSYDDGVVTTEPKCEAEGVKTFTCSVCNDSYTEPVAQLGHKYVGVETKAPTCTETGVMTYTCQNDSSHTYTETIKENGHTITKVDAKAATCEDFGWNAYEYCSVCDYTTYEKIEALGHDYVGVVTTEPTCTEKGVMTYTCKNDASHTYTEPVSALNHIDSDNNGYCDREGCGALICDHVGQDTVLKDDKKATCTADGYTGDVRCAKCDVIVEYGTKIDMLGHAWSETYTSNGNGKDNTHYQTCTRENCGVKNEAVAHTWNDGVVTTDPTCEGEGEKTFTCTAKECGATYTEAVAANGHNYGEWIEEDPATCVATGTLGHYECSVCHKNFDADKAELADLTIAIDDNNHVTTTDHEQTDATCLTVGYTAGTFCEDCDKWISGHEEIEAIAHKNKVHHEKVDSTCSATGTIEYWSCPDCGNNFSDEECNTAVTDLTIKIDPEAHKWDEGKVTTEPGCTAEGVKTYTCQHNAEHTYTDSIPATNHQFDMFFPANAATCVKGGNKAYKLCSNCRLYFAENAEINSEDGQASAAAFATEIDSNNHVQTTNHKQQDATCTEIGYTAGTFCEDCGKWISGHEEIEATGHAYGAWTFDADGKHKRVCANDASHVETEACADSATDNDCNCDQCGNFVAHSYGNATCDAPASCTVCGETTGEALGHDFSVFVETVDYTCTTDGYTTYKCIRCAETENRDITKAAHRPAADFAVIEKASCDKAGYKAILCTECNEELETETIAKREHNLVDTTVEKAPTCSATGIMNQKCDCAETDEYAACDYTTTRVMDKVADAHKAEADYTVIEKASCDKAGYKAILCEYCDAELSKETIAKREHNLVDATVALAPTCSATGIMNQKCDCAETAEYAACDYTTTREIEIDADAHKAEADYIQTVAPTCSAVGEEKLYCEYCNAVLDTREVAIDADAHKAEADYTVMQKATCEADGYKAILCEYCDAELATETIAKLGHAYVGVVTTEPGCETEGVKTFTCSNDENHVYTEAIAALGHTEVTDNAVAPTCTETGLTEGKHCSACGKVLVAQETVDALGHSAAEAVKENVVAATCEADGSYDNVVRCSVCKVVLASEHVVEEKLGHDYKLADLMRPTQNADGTWGNGYATYVCQNDAKHYYSELVNRADYTEYDKVISDLEARLEDDTLSDEVRAEIESLLEANKVEADRIESEQDAVNAVVGALAEGSTNYMKTFKVTFVADGEVVSEQTVSYGSAATAPEAPEKEGFVFTGWEGKYTNIKADTTVTAVFYEGDIILTLSAKELGLAVGKTAQLTATVFPEEKADIALTWAVDNPAVATVDANGVVTGVKNGTTIVTVSALDGKISAKAMVYVYNEGADYTVQLAKSKYGSFVVGDYIFYDTAYINIKPGQEFKFRFALNSSYSAEDIIITVNGQDLSVDADNYFTIPYTTDNLMIMAVPAPGSGLENGDDTDNSGTNNTAHSCWCHSSNKLLQFLWKILMFFCKLFGVESYHYCACGEAHW